MNPVEIKPANSPIILAMPHSGTYLPPAILDCLNETGKKLQDTDWHIDQLYEGLLPEAGIVKATFHRYVIDANRDPEGVSLYPGQNTTTLCPLIDFDNVPIWQDGQEPDKTDIQQRTQEFHAPYHHALRDMLEGAKEKYGYAILYDCHSIRSQVPFLFEGTLPTLNIGTNDSKSCARQIEKIAVDCCADSAFSSVVNGRFKGGWTTRHYGRPQENIHAIQMEIAQSAYMEEKPPWKYDKERAAILRNHLSFLLSKIKNITF